MGQSYSWWFSCFYWQKEFCVPPGWEHPGFILPYSQNDASARLYQGTPAVPVTFYTWERVWNKRGKWDKMDNLLFYPEDPFST